MFAQEINCFNGLDDDGDGLVDIWDDDCPCGENQVINNCPSTCTYTLEPQPYNPQIEWSGQVVDAREQVLVGDVDNDGIPEVIVDNYGGDGTPGGPPDLGIIYVLDGMTGATEHTIVTGLDLTQNNSSNGIADTDGDGFGEIYVIDRARTITRFDFDGTAWSLTYTNTDLVNHAEHVPSFADFNGDGNPELYTGDMIYDPTDGSLIVQSAIFNEVAGMSVAADILPDGACANCAGLELVVGKRVYSVDIATATIAVEVELAAANGGFGNRNVTSIADVDNDGDLDVVYSTAILAGQAGLVVWDGQTDALLMPNYVIPPGLSGLTSTLAGRVNIADFDGDGLNEFGFQGKEIYVVVDDVNAAGAPQELWNFPNTDVSGLTGSTVFDFEADGIAEVIYRDQSFIRVFDGATGTILYQRDCTSGTRYEYPVIADVDKDGQTELICTCGGGVTTFKSSNAPWAASRSVWNQHAYNVTNINDDLTVPAVPANNATAFGGVFNNFLQQTSPRSADGSIVLRAADANVLSIVSDQSSCPVDVQIIVTISNTGDADLAAGFSISVYDADPTIAGANYLKTFITTSTVAVGATSVFTFSFGSGIGFSNAYFVANDPGTLTLPINFDTDFPATSQAECNYSNNMFFAPVGCEDTDGDGVPDTEDICDGFDDNVNTDLDDVPDGCDLDDDNDGILDTEESCSPVDGVITNATGNGTTTPTGTFSNPEGTEVPFSIMSDFNTNISNGGVTSGLQLFWNQGSTDIANMSITFGTPTQGVISALRVSNRAPGATTGIGVAPVKELIFSWPGSGLAVLTDPLDEIDNFPSGVYIASGTPLILTDAPKITNSSEWSLEIDLSSVNAPITVFYNSDTRLSPAGTFANEPIAFSPIVDCDLDNDGIPNIRDLDSDGDGCFDAVEGDGTYEESQLNINGEIILGVVDASGVPNNGTSQLNGDSKTIGPDTDTDTIPDACDDCDDSYLPTANAGSDEVVCDIDLDFDLLNQTTVATFSTIEGETVQWTSSGTGSFTDDSIASPVYTFSTADLLQNDITLTLTVIHPCSSNLCTQELNATNLN